MSASIVVVDAEPIVRSVVTRILEKAGYDIRATGDPHLAIQLIKETSPALVITNVYLPGITGHDAMRLFKESCPGIRVLMVSGLPDHEAIQNWINEDGFDAFPKPFGPDALVKKVREIIDRPEPS